VETLSEQVTASARISDSASNEGGFGGAHAYNEWCCEDATRSLLVFLQPCYCQSVCSGAIPPHMHDEVVLVSICVADYDGDMCFEVESTERMVLDMNGHGILVAGATLHSAEDLFKCYVRPDLGRKAPIMAASLDGAQEHVRSIVMGNQNRFALVTCATQDKRNW
jgi:hypothetical protein